MSEPGQNWNAYTDDDFRQQVRSFIEAQFPAQLRNHPRRIPRWADTKDWYLTLSGKGWLAPNWPREYGGMGLDPGKLLIFTEEIERWGIPRLYDMGIFMLGPILIRYGTQQQRDTYLPKILSGEHRWSQGYSEPEAGSDLASLRTKAEPTPTGFVLNGSKTWATFLDDATHMFVLARTKRAQRKQEGISFLLVDLASRGVQRRLIRTLPGYEELGEVIFDDVQVPIENLVGGLHQGWRIAKDLLGFERINNGSPKQGLYALGKLAEFASTSGLAADPVFVERFTQLRLDIEDQTAAYRYFCEYVKTGKALGPEISFLKIWSTETFQKICDLFMESAAEMGVELEHKEAVAGDALRLYYNSRPATIYSGSNEIQRNIIAQRVLGLPK